MGKNKTLNVYDQISINLKMFEKNHQVNQETKVVKETMTIAIFHYLTVPYYTTIDLLLNNATMIMLYSNIKYKEKKGETDCNSYITKLNCFSSYNIIIPSHENKCNCNLIGQMYCIK